MPISFSFPTLLHMLDDTEHLYSVRNCPICPVLHPCCLLRIKAKIELPQAPKVEVTGGCIVVTYVGSLEF